MYFRFTYSFFLFISGFLFIQAQNNSVERYLKNNLPNNKFFDSINTGIANQIFSNKDNYTALSANYYNAVEKNSIQQKGDGTTNYSFKVVSNFLIDSTNYVWGNVHYKNGKRKNIKWNESSDYDKIYPYIMADSVGGNIATEEYFVQGGYNRKLNKFNFGILAEYRALLEYRNRDPRPKNTISDLNIGLGISTEITKNKLLSLNVILNKYTQSNVLKFFNQLGNPEVFHFSGMGIYNNLFKSNNKRAYYDGNGTEFQLAYLNKTKKGLMASASFSSLSIDKIMLDLQGIVSNNIDEKKYKFNISYSTPELSFFKGIRISTEMQKRKGTEGIFYNETSSNYKKIGEATRYFHDNNNVRFVSLFELIKSSKIHHLALSPFVNYSSLNERYTEPFIQQKIEKITFGFESDLLYQLNKKSIINIGFELGLNKNLSNNWNSNYRYNKQSIQEMMNQNFRNLSSNNYYTNLSYRQNYSINEKYSIFMDAKYGYTNTSLDKIYNSYLELSFGILF
ncbi:DUF6850 family outer membrane beta-barrel protein [Empedobacter brevis]|uniref:DUF6850 family outer membrane beta-barrel protein n=1 Tax=Empedobacter brevis TaxID=247 RepID=UPI0039B04014